MTDKDMLGINYPGIKKKRRYMMSEIYMNSTDKLTVGTTKLAYDPNASFVTSDGQIIRNARPADIDPGKLQRPVMLRKGDDIQALGTNFQDNFDANLPDTYFYARTGANGNPFNCGFNPSNVKVSGGIMSLILNNTPSSGKQYSSGEIQSLLKYSYGRFETYMKPSKESGCMNGSFFTYTGTYGQSDHYEIDLEFINAAGKPAIQCNYYTKGVGNHEHIIYFDTDLSADYHNVGFDWKTDSLTWIVDGNPLYSVTNNIPSGPGQLMANFWNGIGVDGWLGPFNYTKAVTTSYDWIKYTAVGTGVEDTKTNDIAISLYPNPSSDKFMLDFTVPETAVNVNVKVLNTNGAEIANLSGTGGRNLLKWEPETTGQYFFVVTSNGSNIATAKGLLIK